MNHTLDYKRTPNYSAYRKRHEAHFAGSPPITEAEFTNISSRPCHYCGVNGPNGIDRADCAKGYEPANCLPCCKHCNYVKGNLSSSDFEAWTERFVNHQTKIRHPTQPQR
jgi:hypothetical protein